jgi:hypothetical protein
MIGRFHVITSFANMISGRRGISLKTPLDSLKFALATKAVPLQLLHIKKNVNYAYYLGVQAIFM